MIIDSHAHIFPTKIATKAVENIGGFYSLPMSGNGLLGDLVASGSKCGVDKFIVNSSATALRQVDQINNFIVESISGYDNVYGLCTLHQDMTAVDIERTIERSRKNGLIGVKLHPDFQKFFIDDRAVYNIYERCEGVLPILFHTGDSRYEYSAPRRLARVAGDFPDLKCIAAHFGGYERWGEVGCYENCPNVYFDTSSSLFKLTKARALEIIDAFGTQRFMFGVDYPMWNYEDEMIRIESLGLGSDDLRAIFSENAIDFYGLK